MLKAYINFEILFVLSFINFFVISESNEDKKSLIDKHVSKRNDPDFQTCLESFDVYQDKIIRTQDSRDMGAKYLNERDVLSRDDCLKLCCETDNCDVFVFEEKSPGGCYLFECGSPEDFKCKFTKHQNYTSAVLKINRHLTELETQIKFTQHEHELTKLRQPPANSNPITVHFPTTESTKNQETINYGIERPPPNQPAITKSRECSRYQFECHTSKECIAIYNACDGIPQCADGSDEAPELGCPATPTPSPLVTTLNPKPLLLKVEQDVEVHKVDQGIKVNPDTQKQYPQQQYTGESQAVGNGYATNPIQLNMNLPSNVPNTRTSYGREGEGMANFHPEQQWAYQYHPNTQGGSQIFTHKGNGLVPQSDRYPQHQYIQQEIPQRGMMQQYGEQIPNDYAKYYYDNVPYRILPQNQPVNNWQMPHKNQEVINQDDSSLNRLENLPVANGPGPDYYYEEAYRNRPQSAQGYGQRAPISQNVHPHIENKAPETVMETSGNEMTAKHDVPKKKPPIVHNVETTTIKPKEEPPAHVSHRKVEKASAEIKMKESLIDDDIDGHSTSPSGAVLSLTMGLCITGLMLIFVGCRMRVVKRRMRRGGKSPYAHDADFLVNGMYL